VNASRVSFVFPGAAVASVSIFEYLLAADGLVNFEYRLEKMITFSRRSITYIHEKWGIPEPFNVGVFGILSVLAIIAFKKIMGKLMGGGSKTQKL
jgi:hypothetical protein